MNIKSKWRIEVSQNGWEYTGYVVVTAEKVNKIEGECENSVLADGILIEFDEKIGQIEKI